MKTPIPYLAITILLSLQSARPDMLELKNGRVLTGRYVGGTPGSVQFETSGGTYAIETSQSIALTFTTPAPPPLPPVSAPSSLMLPSGTTLLVRMMDSVSSKSPAGANFATKLEYDLVVNGALAVRAGTTIYGKVQSSTQARRAFGRSTLDIRLTQIVSSGNPISIATSSYAEAGEASIKKAARGAAAGAAIGAIVDGGDGAGKGAAIGATASLLKKGQTVTMPPGALLEFTLTQPVLVQSYR